MTDHDQDADAELDRVFRAARATRNAPPGHLMLAVLRQGLAVQPPARQSVPTRREARPTHRVRRVWTQAAALAACLLAGLIAGLVGPGLFETQQSTDPAGDILAFYDLATETDG